MVSYLVVGGKFNNKKILDIKRLSNGWILLKTENTKSERDFKVRTVLQLKPRRSFTPKHAHFAIDFYGKLCANKDKAMEVLEAIVKVWNREEVEEVLKQYEKDVKELPGYSLEYILHALDWILEQEDVNFRERPPEKQKELNQVLRQCNITIPEGRLGSQLAIALLCYIAQGIHPVEAMIKANLDVLPVKRARGAR